jgi:hypothetical protein
MLMNGGVKLCQLVNKKRYCEGIVMSCRKFFNKSSRYIVLILIITIISPGMVDTGCIGIRKAENSPLTVTQSIDSLMNITYKEYKLRGDDAKSVKGQFIPPLFSLEYPEIFERVEYNRLGSYSYDSFHLSFRHFQEGIPESEISIQLQNPDYPDPNKGTIDSFYPPLIKKRVISVCGIESDYYEDYKFLTNPGYDPYHVSIRLAVFKYQNLDWMLSLDWCYRDNEPLEISQYFEHLISTFKIIDKIPRPDRPPSTSTATMRRTSPQVRLSPATTWAAN